MKVTAKAAETAIVGLDIGDRYSYYVGLEKRGLVSERGRLATKREAMEAWAVARAPLVVVMEAGTHSPWVSRTFETYGHRVVVANPRRVRLISHSANKRDRVDAELLARLGRVDAQLLAPIKHRGAEAQAALSVLHSRHCLVRARTALVNHVRGVVKAVGERLPRCSVESLPHKVQGCVPEELRSAVGPVLSEIADLTVRIRSYDRDIEVLARERFPEAGLLQQVGGVGALTALAFVLTLEDPARFSRSRTVGSYLGLRPRQRESGMRRPELRITKEGDEFLRWLLVQAAHYILGPFGPDTDLRRWGLRLVARGGKHAKQRAAVAVARKLAVLLHRLWASGTVYEPLRQATIRAAA